MFISGNCKVSWILEEDIEYRWYFEDYLNGLIKPQFGVYEEL